VAFSQKCPRDLSDLFTNADDGLRACTVKTTLIVLRGNPRGIEIPLKDRGALVGRDANCQIRLTSNLVSKQHCRIEVTEGCVTLTDVGSRNGTFLNDERITRSVQLKHGDQIRVGDFLFGVRVVSDVAGTSPDPTHHRNSDDSKTEHIPKPPRPESVNSEIIADWLEEECSQRLPTILLIDRSTDVQTAFREATQSLRCEVEASPSTLTGLNLWRTIQPDVVVVDSDVLSGQDYALVEQAEKKNPARPLIIMADSGVAAENLIRSVGFDVFDYLLKPLDPQRVQLVVSRAINQPHEKRFSASKAADPGAATHLERQLLGASPAMRNVCGWIDQVASTDAPLLILGEPGCGKETIARLIHQRSNRHMKPLMELRCGAGTKVQIERDLYGFERGAFGAAERRKMGKFEQWPDATLILYEVEALSPDSQVRLLHVLQEKRFTRLGGNTPVSTNVRVIAVTEADLEALATAGRFRREVYYLLNAFAVRIPALRERGNDIDLLTDAYIAQTCRELHRHPPIISPDARIALRSYHWPANLRELHSVLRKAVLRANDGVLSREHLDFGLNRFGSKDDDGMPMPDDEENDTQTLAQIEQSGNASARWEDYLTAQLENGARNLYSECLPQMERELITRTLHHVAGDTAKAAELLGLTHSGLQHKLQSLGIKID
jgi:DNA-binding NtrC family response regulator